ncbi:MAG TPA: TetR/AcrR family transcriptional regulator [Henriciella marina]|uniref:TetR/AcrR family transcriptional regulator n=1 Tax=Henriciella sp. TaxID=1968823 RepID=UPI00179F32C1|nr:TetR/AcrR family transcriptional regulator [Henriciella sp.]HIG23995.1 TetR/AcrR family transcriptional regulator [Henriciella sp.]HIK63531.1 TetR/AcrR family transcriptional regulator [Henriciella marina]
MARHEDRREELLDKIADHLLREGIAGSNLRPLAKAIGLSDRMLLYYFRDKDDILEAGLGRVADRLTDILNHAASERQLPSEELRAKLAPLLLDDAIWPYMQLWLEIASLSARNQAPFSEVGASLGRHFLAWAAAQLDVAEEQARRAEAVRLCASLEGLVLLKSLGLGEEAKTAY